MGIWVYLGVWPDEGFELAQAQFARLASDLITERLLAMPCVVLEGAIDISETPLVFHNMLTGAGAAALPETIKIRYQGDYLLELLRVPSAMPFGATDLCVVFNGFDRSNAALQESFKNNHWSNAFTALYALQTPQEVTFTEEVTPFLEGVDDDEEFEHDPDEEEEEVDGRTYLVQQGFFSYGKRGPKASKIHRLIPCSGDISALKSGLIMIIRERQPTLSWRQPPLRSAGATSV